MGRGQHHIFQEYWGYGPGRGLERPLGVYLDGYFTYVGASDSQVGATQEHTLGPVDFTINKQIRLGGLNINVPIPGR